MARTLIRGGRIVDPANGVDEVADLIIEDDRIGARGRFDPERLEPPADRVIDATGRLVVPGLVDIHVHLREPGNEEKETIATGAAAAVAGGFTSIACMPNTEPAIDNESQVEYVLRQAERAGLARVYPIGAITKGREGEELAEMGGLSQAGAVAFSDDGSPVRSAEMMRRGLLYSTGFDRPIITHAEDLDLTGDGVMNQGLVSVMLGLEGKPNASEDVGTGRDILLAEATGAHLHVAHVSTRGSIELVRQAKARGVEVTCEVCPHHFTLTDEAVKSFDTDFKMAPPLRTHEDVEAVIAGLEDGTVDAIASDHAPHTREEKALEFSYAPDGVIGLETMFPITYTHLVEEGRLGLSEAVALLTCKPARILNLDAGTLSEGAPADVAILDLEDEWLIDPEQFHSKSRNCPFKGWKVKGRTVATLVAGRVVYPF